MALTGQLSKPKLELQLYNRDRLEITNYKHHLILKLAQMAADHPFGPPEADRSL